MSKLLLIMFVFLCALPLGSAINKIIKRVGTFPPSTNKFRKYETHVDGFYYYTSTERMNYKRAEETCKNEYGATLVVAASRKEEKDLLKAIEAINDGMGVCLGFWVHTEVKGNKNLYYYKGFVGLHSNFKFNKYDPNFYGCLYYNRRGEQKIDNCQSDQCLLCKKAELKFSPLQ